VLACVFILTRYKPVELPPDFNSVCVCGGGGVYVVVCLCVCICAGVCVCVDKYKTVKHST